MFFAGGASTNPVVNTIAGVVLVVICVLAVVGYYVQKLQWWSQDRRARKQQGHSPVGDEDSSNTL